MSFWPRSALEDLADLQAVENAERLAAESNPELAEIRRLENLAFVSWLMSEEGQEQ